VKRNAINHLIAWKERKEKKPLWITGIKNVGKTYLALDFAKSFYDGNLYVNFETNAAVRQLISVAVSSPTSEENFIELLCRHFQIPTELVGNLLIILDEIGECKEAITALEELIIAGSNVSILVLSSTEHAHNMSLFESLTMYPMEFDEFLVALGHEWYAEVIKGHYQTNRKVPEIVHNELLSSFDDYLIVGGMPAAVNDFITMEGTQNVSEIHQQIFQNLLARSMSNHDESEALKISQVMNIMTEQLMKDNKKFQYRLIRKGATYGLYKEAIDSLVTKSYLYKCTKNTYEETSKSEDQKAAEDTLQFKLYLPDVGLLNTLLRKSDAFIGHTEGTISKTLLENYMMQSLIARGHHPCFWESQSLAKIDFIIETQDGIVPIEAKTDESTRSKSIGVFKATHETQYSIRVSTKNFEFANQVKNIPFYSIFCLS
jgi:predicted AAA+ superfamily ATPase